MGKVCIVGSINLDLVMSVDKLPNSGATIHALSVKKICGGKGANQAIAAKRLGSYVTMIGCVGKDENGNILIESMQKDGIDIKCIRIDDKFQQELLI